MGVSLLNNKSKTKTMKNQIEYLESVIAHCEGSINWMNRPDQDDDYVVCGTGWHAVQEKRTDAVRWISDLKNQGFYFDHSKKSGFVSYCKGNEQVSVREGQWGDFAIIDGKCVSNKKMKKLGYEKLEETLKVDLEGNETWEMV